MNEKLNENEKFTNMLSGLDDEEGEEGEGEELHES